MGTKSSDRAEDVSVQVFLDNSVSPDRIAPHLKARMVEFGDPDVSIGRISKLARSVALTASPGVVKMVLDLPEVVDVLSETNSDYYSKPVKVRPLRPSASKPRPKKRTAKRA